MALPPGGLQEICFSFDTTGSMYSCLDEVRGRIQDMIQRLQADIPGIKIAVFAHGDYCDRSNYITKHIDFTTDAATLCKWVNDVGRTSGGDADECYELVLHEVQSLNWTPGSQRALVMIGDNNPHEPNYPQNNQRLDWRTESDNLSNMGVRIYSVQCQNYNGADHFYKTIAEKTSGHYLKLAQFTNIFDFIMSICYREKGAEFLQDYEKEVRARDATGGIHKDLDTLFGVLKRADSSHDDTKMDTTVAPKPPALIKVSSLTKVPSLTNMKKKMGKTSLTSRRTGTTSKPRTVTKNAVAPKVRRENVPESHFALSSRKWSDWQTCLSCDKTDSDLWEKRNGAHFGYRRKDIFDGKLTRPTIYEFAVQIVPGHKRHIVYSKLCHGLTFADTWERRLLGQKDVRGQIEDILSKGCSVAVRRLKLVNRKISKAKAVNSLRCYDYAWRRYGNLRTSHRCVVKGSVQISNDTF
ncbi:uncharacterized protein LOC110446844 [Mizuhopecten yessoensis]|uniref:VWFA domain-containing protein n=1 Tax=Mizuhopecten yessoensis TaxID=6573 RepID=A0A210QWC9_MIZYE|nr:uncharacterized protein LOC110446844 [Mizuhopecten yessoensis]OWF53078.1 hypothetical protein KP79_PYT00500 [Mizuhopecten yessoensis]